MMDYKYNILIFTNIYNILKILEFLSKSNK